MLKAEELVASLPPSQSQGLPWPGLSYPKVKAGTNQREYRHLVSVPTLSIKARSGSTIEDKLWNAQELLVRGGDLVLSAPPKPQARTVNKLKITGFFLINSFSLHIK